MRYVAPWKKELSKKIDLFGLSRLDKIAPIGDLGYMNGWYGPFGGDSWFNGLMERTIVDAVTQQGYEYSYEDRSYHRGTDNEYYCKELRLTYHIDSSD